MRGGLRSETSNDPVSYSCFEKNSLSFGPYSRALPDDAVPAGLIGLGPVGFGRRAIELDGLDAGVGLALGFALRCPAANSATASRFAALGGLAQHVLLRVVEACPRLSG